MARAAVIKTKRRVRNVLENRKYFGYIKAATDLVRVASASLGIPLTLPDPSNLGEIISKGYNPPLIDLGILRAQIVWGNQEDL